MLVISMDGMVWTDDQDNEADRAGFRVVAEGYSEDSGYTT
jgi:hypothetical protein